MPLTRSLLCLGVFLLVGYAQAAHWHPYSQKRRPTESYEQALVRVYGSNPLNNKIRHSEESANQRATTLDHLDSSKAPIWTAVADATAGFDRVRDERFLQTSDHPNFPRRSSWLFPDDGCYARAALMESNLKKWGYAPPAKVFIFGNLTVKTSNSPDGAVSWWYHVAPVIKSEGKLFVLDPAINPKGPTELTAWVDTMTHDRRSVTLSVCNGMDYSPGSSCDSPSANEDSSALDDQRDFLGEEWSRVVNLKMNPQKVLGSEPPWAH